MSLVFFITFPQISDCRPSAPIPKVLMYFNRGSLPWQGLKANSKKEHLANSRLGRLSHASWMSLLPAWCECP